jgi:ABC-2 type transport system ATP-binding protein
MTATGTTLPQPAPPDAEAVVTIAGLSKRYGQLWAVHDVHLAVPKGSVFGLIGPNGAGKSTTFSVLAALVRPTAGQVRVAGFDPVTQPTDVRRHMGYMPDVMGVYDNLAVDEYLRFFAASYRVPRKRWPALVDDLLELVDLADKKRALVDSLSRGMKQRLSLARALVHDPDVLVLDEPASGLDPRARVDLRQLLTQLSAMGKTIVISSHILAELEEMCTEVAILEAGKLIATGAPRDLFRTLAGGRTVRVRIAGQPDQVHVVADEAEQHALLRRLVVDDGLSVLEFAEEGGSLESTFLALTKGVVQ